MHSIEHLKAPGLKRRRNRDGTVRLHWVARTDLVKAGYQPKTVRLHYDEADHLQREMIVAACHRHQTEMLEWAAGRRNQPYAFDGTLKSLIACYQMDAASPYRELKWNTQRTYDQVLGIISKAFGSRSLAALGIADFRRWYDAAKKPRKLCGPERVRKAHGIISMIRRLVAYGKMTERPHCARLAGILDEARFKQPARRRAKLELRHVRAIVAKAVEVNRLSLALGTAIQFETTLRQRDVIGEWEPAGADLSGIVLNGRRWVNGLTWADLGSDLVVFKDTTKTGQTAAHDLKLFPMVIDILNRIPPDRRIGPLIVDETAGRPYAEHAYARDWRTVARAAGVPDDVWNMDARAGGISEADDAGAELDDIRSSAAHSQASTTARYVRGTIGKSRKVAKLRQAHRTGKNET